MCINQSISSQNRKISNQKKEKKKKCPARSRLKKSRPVMYPFEMQKTAHKKIKSKSKSKSIPPHRVGGCRSVDLFFFWVAWLHHSLFFPPLAPEVS